MTLTIRLAVRDWDYLTPLALGDVTSPLLGLQIERVAMLPAKIGVGSPYDAGETSFSRHVSQIEAGNTSTIGLPNFLMRGFRHQCIITRKDSSLTTVKELAGKRIGVTGWRDSGNIWTRTILRRAGVMTEDAYWYAGRLTKTHPITDRLDGFGDPGRIEPMPGEVPMMESLAAGWLDAVFTPFMPTGFFDTASDFRLLLPDCRDKQLEYFSAEGYVPGIHLLGLDAELAEKHPWLAAELSRVIDESRTVWTEKRRRYADTTPFMLTEMLSTATALPAGWDASGHDANAKMIAAFIHEMKAQKILGSDIDPDAVFPMQVSAQELA